MLFYYFRDIHLLCIILNVRKDKFEDTERVIRNHKFRRRIDNTIDCNIFTNQIIVYVCLWFLPLEECLRYFL
jgi:hypothetical protein